jgi:SAM-dependent methyltransferase
MTQEQNEVIAIAGTVVGVDLDAAGLRAHAGIRKKIFGDIVRLPIRSASFDVISANMVMEHLGDPSALLREAHRVLSPGGFFVIHTPNWYHWGTLLAASMPDRLKKLLIRFFEGRSEQDVFKTHYKINTAGTARLLAEREGFEVVSVSLVSSSATLKMLGPLVIAELLYIRLLERPALASLRSNLIIVLRKACAHTSTNPPVLSLRP